MSEVITVKEIVDIIRQHGTEASIRAVLSTKRVKHVEQLLERHKAVFAKLVDILEKKKVIRRGSVVSLLCAGRESKMANEQTDVLEWKKASGEFNWKSLCTKLTKMMNELPNEEPGEFALITRKPSDPAATGKVINASTFEEAIKGVIKPDEDDFTAKWFVAYDKKVAVLITKLNGDERGTHYLVGPNVFPADMRHNLNFLRAMEKAADNAGPA